MKTRDGFVSNSSSTSFTLMTTEAEHAKILTCMQPAVGSEVIEAIDALMSRKQLGGVNFVVMDVEYGDVESVRSGRWHGFDQQPTFKEGNGFGNRAGEVSLSELVHQYREAAKSSGADVVFSSHTR